MPTRRWLLRTSALAGLGAAALGVGALAAAESAPGQQLARRVAARISPRREPTAWAQSQPPDDVVISVDANQPFRSISPLIYGVSAATPAQLEATGARLNRWGGNPNSRYNWRAGDAWNAARDWEFRNYGSPGSANTEPSRAADAFISNNRTAGAMTWLTVPALGWVARDGDPAHASWGVPAEGGPPISSSSDAIDGYDPASNRAITSVRSVARVADAAEDVVAQDAWVAHVVERFGRGDGGGVALYAVDNEPDLWATTHTDVHPVRPDYAEMLSVYVDYASAIKDVDPSARLTGPSLSGWLSLLYSARDRGADNFRSHADRRAHGDMPFLAWWLDQLRQNETANGRRLLDAIDVHYYPQADGVYGPVGDEATQRRRLRSTRSLWDPTYVDESWIGEAVTLIPRLKAWRDQFYPGTALAIGEWNFGADDTLNGALAIAHVLGIFGREGVDAACYWTSPGADTHGAQAFALYTNYDGRGSGFGDQALRVTSSAADDVAAYASRDSASGDIVSVVLNHRPDAELPVTLHLSAHGGTARWFIHDATNPSGIRDVGDVVDEGGGFHVRLPAQSLSVLRIGH